MRTRKTWARNRCVSCLLCERVCPLGRCLLGDVLHHAECDADHHDRGGEVKERPEERFGVDRHESVVAAQVNRALAVLVFELAAIRSGCGRRGASVLRCGRPRPVVLGSLAGWFSSCLLMPSPFSGVCLRGYLRGSGWSFFALLRCATTKL